MPSGGRVANTLYGNENHRKTAAGAVFSMRNDDQSLSIGFSPRAASNPIGRGVPDFANIFSYY
jgi:hypothetical protein